MFFQKNLKFANVKKIEFICGERNFINNYELKTTSTDRYENSGELTSAHFWILNPLKLVVTWQGTLPDNFPRRHHGNVWVFISFKSLSYEQFQSISVISNTMDVLSSLKRIESEATKSINFSRYVSSFQWCIKRVILVKLCLKARFKLLLQ